MDVELEEMEEGIVYEIDRAVDVLLDAEEEFEGSPRFVAGGEGDVGELAGGVCDVFARVSALKISMRNTSCNGDRDLHRPIQTANGNRLADFVAG